MRMMDCSLLMDIDEQDRRDMFVPGTQVRAETLQYLPGGQGAEVAPEAKQVYV